MFGGRDHLNHAWQPRMCDQQDSGVLRRLGWGNRLAFRVQGFRVQGFRVQGLGLRVYRRSDPALNHAAIKYSDIIDYLKESRVHDLPNVPCHMLISEE